MTTLPTRSLAMAMAMAMALGCWVWPATAVAQDASVRAAPPRAEVVEPARGEWGWYVILSGWIAGAALTGYGLTIDCAEDDASCQRRASLSIAGGVGVASIGTLIGIRIVQIGREPATGATTIRVGTSF